MIDATLVSGFLGAGKTTWLAEHLRRQEDGVDLVVVNDFADQGVDDALLREAASAAGARVEPIVGGCLCCDRADDLRRVLHAEIGRRHRGGAARDGRVVVETSGLAEPHRITRMLADDPVLRTNLSLRSLVVVVDGLGGRRLLRHRHGVRDQVALADRVVLSRADLARDGELEELAATVGRLNATAELVASTLGTEQPVTPADPAVADVFDDDGTVAEPDVRSCRVDLAEGTSWAEYALWLDTMCRVHPDRLLRSKGIVPTRDGRLLVQSMGGDVATPLPAPPGVDTGMVFVLDRIDPDALVRSLRTHVPSAGA